MDRRIRRATRIGGIGLALVLATTLAACSNATTKSADTLPSGTSGTLPSGGPAPGVTPTEIDVGALATESGALSTGFGEVVDGVQAYFDMVNAEGGVNGRKIDLKYNLDDAASGSNDATQFRNLVEQDKVFAIVGVGTPFFAGTSYLAQTGTPTFGYIVTDNWAGPPNLFGAYGSVLSYNAESILAPYLAHELKATKPAVVAYDFGPSQAPCQAFTTALATYGPKVAFQDLNFSLGGDASADVQQMKSAGVDVLETCMEGNDNLSFVKAMQQNGMGGTPSFWLNGYSRSLISQNPTAMNNVIFGIQHVPFEAATQFPGVYPGIEQYITTMQKYEPQWVYDDTAFQGWVNAAQFVAGLKAIGTNVTQTRLVDAINQETDFNADGTIPPINWTKQHTQPPVPLCLSYVQAQNGKTKVVFTTGSKVFVCLNNNSPVPVTPNTNTPGA